MFNLSGYCQFPLTLAVREIFLGPHDYLHLVLLVMFILTIPMDYFICSFTLHLPGN